MAQMVRKKSNNSHNTETTCTTFLFVSQIGWDSFLFFYWKNGPRNDGFLVENGNNGTVLRFFLKRQLKTIK